MTFNIRGAEATGDGINAWGNRSALNVRTILEHTPDLIGVQEMQTNNLATYKERLPAYRWVLGPETGPKNWLAFNAIFWRDDRFQLLESGGFWLSETPDRPSIGWDSAVVRAANWVILACRSCGVELLHVNTHLDHRGERARTEGVKLILRQLEHLERPETPTVVTGDFNCSAPRANQLATGETGPEPYILLTEGGFVDAYLVQGRDESGPANSFHGFLGEDFVPRDPSLSVRIDWIMTRDGLTRWRVRCSSILRDHQRPLYPSDHYPVLAELAIAS